MEKKNEGILKSQSKEYLDKGKQNLRGGINKEKLRFIEGLLNNNWKNKVFLDHFKRPLSFWYWPGFNFFNFKKNFKDQALKQVIKILTLNSVFPVFL